MTFPDRRPSHALALRVTGAFLGRPASAFLDGPDDAGRYRLVPPASFQGLVLQESGPRVDAIKHAMGVDGAVTRDSGTPAGGAMRCGTLADRTRALRAAMEVPARS
ncbi:hypothetical protein QEZ40_001617 [Streptomyces katrae]|uniref:Uncharacterized protein n=1 Tax=Streptomyces katrae TaxID=68223 RepID=A0ABT7GTN3_9ACTN|nr:hypothetical protein [Streptomyces katrae]MDK9496974.1 hypothetical protein [Streptomyces katrae]